MKLAGRTALVTGGSRGIGGAIVRALAKKGAQVAFVYQSNVQAAEKLTADLAAEDLKVSGFQADVKQADQAGRVVKQFVNQFEKLDILVNNAGIIRDGLLATMSEQDWHDVIETNLTSVFHFCHAAARPMMSARYGRIINMSSVSSEFGNPGQSNYAASKAGVEGFTRCLASELARRNITVNAIAPGFIQTDMTQAVMSAAGDKIAKRIPLRRLGEPQDVAHAVAFLASDQASYITGQVIKVDGGLTLGGYTSG